MSKNFIDSLKATTLPDKLTENGADAYSTLNSALLDAFSIAGSLRSRTDGEIQEIYRKAYDEDPQLALRLLFYTGDIRYLGLGERRTFRIWLRWLAENHPSVLMNNLWLIPYYNRWDSIFVLLGTECEDEMAELVQAQFLSDLKDPENCSLLAKWLPSENAHSKETKKLAKIFMGILGFSPRDYRKALSFLRAHCNVVEREMSSNKWGAVAYDKVPSVAMNRYNPAFARHDYERFSYYLREVRGNVKKINAGTLYPYNIVEKMMYKNIDLTERETLELQWKNLPNYVSGENNYLVMADVSGSMSGRPMATSVGLAIYFAQRNKGYYKNSFMTFTDNPTVQTIDPNKTLYENIRKVTANVGYSTNLEAAFNLIYTTARRKKMKQADLPAALIVISDMEINRYMAGSGMDFLGTFEAKFKAIGLEMPKIVFWNVASRANTYLSNDPNVINVSGQSTNAFKSLCGYLEGKTAYDFMVETLMNPAYNLINWED